MWAELNEANLRFQYKLCKVRKIFVGTKGIPHLVTHDARTIRYPDPLIKVNDTIQIDLETGKITDFIKFDTGKQGSVQPGHFHESPGIRTILCFSPIKLN